MTFDLCVEPMTWVNLHFLLGTMNLLDTNDLLNPDELLITLDVLDTNLVLDTIHDSIPVFCLHPQRARTRTQSMMTGTLAKDLNLE